MAATELGVVAAVQFLHSLSNFDKLEEGRTLNGRGGACALAMALFAAVDPTSVQRLVFSDIDIWHLSRKRQL